MKYLLYSIVLVSFLAPGQTKYAYQIDLKVQGLADTTAYLGNYYGESTYLIDTAQVNHAGEFSFFGKKPLGQGVYFLVINKTRLFEFVVSEQQHFKLSTNTQDYVKNMVVTGDTDNKIFFENMLFNGARNLEADPFIKIVSDSTATEASKLPARTALDDINKKVFAYQDGLLAQHPSTLTARILKSTRQIDIPAPPKKADGSIDSTFQFRYYRKHYWDNFNLRDDALIRLPRPAYQEKIKDYFTRFVPPIADSINSEIDRLAAIAKPNQETYKYFIWMCVIQFQNPTIMGLDGVFVHIIRKYFDSGEMNFWINAKMRSQLKERADQLSLSLMGMDANNLIMQDQNLKPRNMFDIKNKYTILYIFDPDCSHCRQETPKLVSFYNTYKTKYDVEVYAVSADTSIQKMKDFIKEFKTPWITVNGPRSYVGSYHKLYDADQTPSLYIIDRRRKIIAKKPPIEELVNFFNNQERVNAGK